MTFKIIISVIGVAFGEVFVKYLKLQIAFRLYIARGIADLSNALYNPAFWAGLTDEVLPLILSLNSLQN